MSFWSAIGDFFTAPIDAVETIGESIGDIVSGKNVGEALGRIVAAPFAAVGDELNRVSFNTLANSGVPIVQDFTKGGSDFIKNPYDQTAAIELAKGLGGGAGAVAGAAYLPAILGTTPAASALASVPVSQKLLSGDVGGAIASAASGSGLLDTDLLGGVTAGDLVSSLGNSGGSSLTLPQVNQIPSTSQLYQNDNTTLAVAIVAVFGIAAWFAWQRIKK